MFELRIYRARKGEKTSTKVASGMMLTLLLIGMFTLAFNIQLVKAEPRTWTVDDDGPADFHTVQDAINAASDGDIIYVYNGTYYENLIIDKRLKLVGESKYNTVIDADYTGSAIVVVSDNTTITGFTLQNSGSEWHGGTGYDSGLKLSGSNCNITNNHLVSNYVGIWQNPSHNNLLATNTIASNTLYGLYLNCLGGNTLRENEISDNKYNSRVLGDTHDRISSYVNDIDQSNTVNGKPIVYLINVNGLTVNPSSFPEIGYLALINSTQILIKDVNVSNNGEGIQLVRSTKSVIETSRITSNWVGVSFISCISCTVTGSEVIDNARYGIYARGSLHTISGNNIENNEVGIGNIFFNHFVLGDDNYVYHNNFVKNKDAHVVLLAQGFGCFHWDNGYPSGGNYWSDYDGTDIYRGLYQNETGCDGIGDTPYVFDPDDYPVFGISDDYPLMNRWPDVTPPNITILSPQNTTYTTTSVPLNFTINECCSWIGHSLDNEANVTITGNITLTGLCDGYHSIVVYANDTSGNMGASSKIFFTVQIPLPQFTLTIYSSPTGVAFTVDGISCMSPWSDTYDEDTSVSLVMPETYMVGVARYCWDQWSDGVTSRSRIVTMDTNITLTAYFTGPYYELTVTSSPITGITFTTDGVPKTTPYTEWLLEGSYKLVMPETHNGYVWSHWLEDGDSSRTKTITLPGTTWTGVYTLPAVGGEMILVKVDEPPPSVLEPIHAWIGLVSAIISTVAVSIVYVKHRKRKQTEE